MLEEGASRPQASAPPWLGVYPKGLDWNMAIEERAVFALLDEAALRFPDHCALDFLGKRSSYRGLAGLVARAVCGFRKLGVQKGVQVGLFLPNCPYYVIAYFAILKAGGTVVNLNPLYAERELLHQIEDSETEILVTLDLDRLQRKIAGLAGRCRLRRIIVCSMVAALPFPKDLGFRLFKWRERARIPPDGLYMPFDALIANDGGCETAAVDPGVDLAALQYTGGTTGTPKGVRLTHANLYANALQISRWFTGAEPGQERILAVLPLFHAFGMTAIMNLALALGGALIMLPRFDPRELLRTIERARATLLLGVPTIFRALVEFPAIGRYDLSSLKVCVSGGDSLPSDLQDRFEALTRCRLKEGYGLTECSPVVACNPFEGAGKPGSVGLPLPRTTVEIVSLADGRSAVPAGERGEILRRWTAGHGRLLEAAGRHGGGPAGWPPSYGRCRLSGQERLCVPRRPSQGRHHYRRLQCLSAQRRGSDPSPSGRGGCRGRRNSGFLLGPSSEGLCRAAAWRERGRKGDPGVP